MTTMRPALMRSSQYVKFILKCLNENPACAKIGSKVTVQIKSKTYDYWIVLPDFACYEEGKVSSTSLAGRMLLGKKAGDLFALPGHPMGVLLKVY